MNPREASDARQYGFRHGVIERIRRPGARPNERVQYRLTGRPARSASKGAAGLSSTGCSPRRASHVCYQDYRGTYQLCAAQRTDARLMAIPIILISSSPPGENPLAGPSCNLFFRKPVDVAVVAASVIGLSVREQAGSGNATVKPQS